MIHETAIIGSGARLGEDVSVGPFTYIEDDVEIGDGCRIGAHVTILKNTSIGPDCEIHAGAVLGDTPQDTAFSEVPTYVKIGPNCVIREGVTIHRGTKEGTSTEIGAGCFLMAFSHFAHNVHLGPGVTVANGALLAGYVSVGERAFVSGNVIVHQFVRLGKLVMMGGQCAVSKDVPPFCMTTPTGLNLVGGLNVVGMRRAGMDQDARNEVKKAFKILYRSDLNVKQALAKIRETFDTGPALEFVEFIVDSSRGICGTA